jgi:hypothetical protein
MEFARHSLLIASHDPPRGISGERGFSCENGVVLFSSFGPSNALVYIN